MGRKWFYFLVGMTLAAAIQVWSYAIRQRFVHLLGFVISFVFTGAVTNVIMQILEMQREVCLFAAFLNISKISLKLITYHSKWS